MTTATTYATAEDLIRDVIAHAPGPLAHRLGDQARMHGEIAMDPARSVYGISGAFQLAADCARAAYLCTEQRPDPICADLNLAIPTFYAAARYLGLPDDVRVALARSIPGRMI